jgi:hypothetical protein
VSNPEGLFVENPHTGKDRRYIVLLMGHRNPYDGTGALRIVQAPAGTPPEEIVRKAHERPPSTTAVKWAWVAELAEPYQPTLVPADVPKPEWGKPRAAR